VRGEVVLEEIHVCSPFFLVGAIIPGGGKICKEISLYIARRAGHNISMQETIREIVFDTETTGLSPEDDRIVEIGCIEMVGHVPSGRTFHVYINPEREVPEDAVKVHGLTFDRLRREKPFRDIVQSFLDFVADAALVAHNAEFDMGFVNAELKRAGREPLSLTRMIDTLAIAHKKVPSLSRYTLDSLCKFYNIDNSQRDLHGALLDARLLAEVYIELLGGKEVDFFKKTVEDVSVRAATSRAPVLEKPLRPARVFPENAEELAAHAAFVESMGEKSVWKA
jgi:DNA polymerase-3 subunit epsilon